MKLHADGSNRREPFRTSCSPKTTQLHSSIQRKIIFLYCSSSGNKLPDIYNTTSCKYFAPPMLENRESQKKNTYTHTHAQNRRVSDTPSLRPEEQKSFFTKNHKPKCSGLVASYKILKNTTTSPLSPTASFDYPRERIIRTRPMRQWRSEARTRGKGRRRVAEKEGRDRDSDRGE